MVEHRLPAVIEIDDEDAARLAACNTVDEMRLVLLSCTTEIEFPPRKGRKGGTAPLSCLATADTRLLAALLPSFKIAGAGMTQDGQTRA